MCEFFIECLEEKNPWIYQGNINVGMTPLHYAAALGHLEICSLIVKNVEDKNPDDRNGWTPLHWAAQFGHLEVCELLIANVIERNPEDIRGVTPLHSAASNGHIEVCELIIQVNEK